ncbi:MAG TPA: 2-hydroxyacid dehydrogenase [Rhodopila sp.]|uniref:2-hydroxyacid dehydrogenase n=1 Tax=Rhodopila sp. TaxID=2480087 RepID=UPI002B5C5786|nr:2-hydroxyacid dehydrogenase [Rhodopila sp.]HVY17871.1 2-hydroxyacid dehydrogenase [Rhodopila sp.]
MQTIVFLQPLNADLIAAVRSRLPDGFSLRVPETADPAHLHACVADAAYVVTWDLGFDAALFAAAPHVRLVHKWGVGVDNIDLEAARARGVTVARTTGSNARPVAEFTVAAILALSRRLIEAHVTTQQGEWRKNEIWRSSSMLGGKIVGIVGFGPIGQQVARCLSGFGCTLLYYKRNRMLLQHENAQGVTYALLPELLRKSDIVTLHTPLTEETRGMIDAAALATMKRTAMLINVARGGVVKEADLVHALRNGMIAAAAVDVFDQEPPPPDHPLLHMDNVLVTPHIGAATFDNTGPALDHLMRNILAFARGERIPASDVVVGP